MFINGHKGIAVVDYSRPAVHLEKLQPGKFYIPEKPDYASLIQATQIRRMGNLIRMSSYCALSLVQDAEAQKPEGIIFGTGLGCIDETLRFLNEIIQTDEGAVSPTSFIHSTHNTIAGQIAMQLKLYGYNSTISQSGISFELALMDTERQLEQGGYDNLLVGAADEMNEALFELLKSMAEKAAYPLPALGQGAAVFSMSRVKQKESKARINEVKTSVGISLVQLLENADINLNSFDLILDGSGILQGANVLHYKKYLGEFYSVSALALDYALYLMEESGRANKPELKRVLITGELFDYSAFIRLEKC